MPEFVERVITRPEELAACCEDLAASRQIGLDTEFVGEDSYHPHLCLIQVATADALVLIDPLTVGPLDAFWKLVVDPERLVVVHAGREEVRLCHRGSGRTPGNLFDLQIAAGLAGLTYPLGHAALVKELLGVQLAKGETRTEWRHRPLTAQQIRYAFDDVRYLLALWERLNRRLEERGRAAWAREEFDRLAANATAEEAAQEKWRKLRGLGGLDRRGLAVMRALYAWRDERAARTNRPARAIIRDDLLVEIARRHPRRERDLQVIRGLPHRDLGAILQVVQEARALAPEHLPQAAEREQDPLQVGLVTNVLQAVLGDLCARWRLAPNLVANTADLRLLVRGRLADQPLSVGSLLTQGWRREHVLPEVLAVLEGRRSVRIADLRAEAPFAVEDSRAGAAAAGSAPAPAGDDTAVDEGGSTREDRGGPRPSGDPNRDQPS
jgi:ribonuclease D